MSAGNFLEDDREALALAKKIVAEELGTDWTVHELGKGARDYRAAPSSKKTIPVGKAWELVQKLKSNRDVFDAEPELFGPGLQPPPEDLPLLEAQTAMRSGGSAKPLPCSDAPNHDWSLSLCRVQNAWQLPVPNPQGKSRGAGILIAHPDTGYTLHSEIWSTNPADNRLLRDRGYNFFNDVQSPTDLLDGNNPGHGTATSSVIMSAATMTSGPRVDGVAPLAKLIPLRVTNTVIIMNFGKLAEAIHYAVEQQCHVISISLGGLVRSRALHRAVKRAADNGIVVLAAAGNVWPWVVYPARFDEVIAVAACNCSGAVWKSSASGSTVDVTAPGESVWIARTERKGDILDYFCERSSGTSFAVATTAGACALWLAYWGRDSLIQKYGASHVAAVFKEVLVKTGVTTPAGWDTSDYGAGILNVESLLRAALPTTPPATGMRMRAKPAKASDMDEIAVYFPKLSRDQLRRGLIRFLKTDEAALPAILADHGDEIVFHVATDALVRAEIYNLSSNARSIAPAVRAVHSARLRKTASRALRTQVEK